MIPEGQWRSASLTASSDAGCSGVLNAKRFPADCRPQGVRECELSRSLTKALPSILAVVKRTPKEKAETDKAAAEAAGSKKGERPSKGQLPERVQPSRRGKPSDLKEGGKAEALPEPTKVTAAKRAGKAEAVQETSGPWEVSVQAAVEIMDRLAEQAAASKVRSQPASSRALSGLFIIYSE